MMTLQAKPYCPGDRLSVERSTHQFAEALVELVQPVEAAAFGCHWQVNVTTLDGDQRLTVLVNDDGINYTIGRRVRPSDHVED